MNLRYLEEGKGKTIVLLHGFCENKEIWNYQINKLKQTYQVVAIDLPGFGDNEPLQGEWTIEKMAVAIDQLLDELAIIDYVVIGHSLGGYVGLAMAELFPERLRGLGLFHSTALLDSEERKLNRDKTIQFIQKHGVTLFSKSFVTPLFCKINRVKYADELEQIKEVVANTSLESMVKTIQAMKNRLDRTHVLKQASFPVLFIIGKQDQALPMDSLLSQCYLPKESHISFLEDTGHMGMIEQKEKTTQVLVNFMEYTSVSI
ncbi:MAG: alpha/beta fold hydrolase [Cyclobacteriaceae bacterium]